MAEMKSIALPAYVELLNKLVAQGHPDIPTPCIKGEVIGIGLQARSHLHIRQQAIHPAALAVRELRKQGIFCFPILAPLDDHFLT
ncbi:MULTISPECIES: hypothetical protein [Achromobacter]|uniref:hypothetical protein n=1 Tax=Achromobacter TaxID=222 RepID=UPI00117748DD|nr:MULTISPECIES: hypothetical protein [Achromobacter]